MILKEQIKNYMPFNQQEVIDRKYFLRFIDTFDDVLTRRNEFGHFTASAFVVNREKSKMIVVDHIINHGWMYPGGHADGEENLLEVAIREVEEETNLKTKILSTSIFGIQSLPTTAHLKNGIYLPAHIHYDVIYLLEANEADSLSYRETESKGVKWIPFEEAEDEDIVDFARPVHKKLIQKLNRRN